jgi:hypothetical protein
MGRRPGHFQDALRFLLRAWRAEDGIAGELREYLVGLASEALEEADEGGMGHFDRMLASDVLRLHRASVEGGPDALTRCRLVAAQERALSKLGLHRTRGVMRSAGKPGTWRTPPVRRRPGPGEDEGGSEARGAGEGGDAA